MVPLLAGYCRSLHLMATAASVAVVVGIEVGVVVLGVGYAGFEVVAD